MNRITLTLACATLVLGTSTYFVTGVLNPMAVDLGVSVGVAGQLVSAFAIAYAVAAPLLAATTARLPRRGLLCAALVTFGAANLLAAVAPDFGVLLLSRVLCALSAALATPIALAVGAGLTPLDRRGAALALVMGGITVAFALGIPLGTYVSALAGWRAMFLGLGGLSWVAAAAVYRVLPPVPGATHGGFGAFAVLREPGITPILVLTVLAIAVGFSVFSYIGPVLSELTGLADDAIGGLLLVFGFAAIAGTYVGGTLADRIDPARMATIFLVMMTLATAGYSLAAPLGHGTASRIAVAAVLFFSAFPGFAFMPLQQYRLVEQAGEHAHLALALNASAVFLGQGLGAMLGGVAAMTGTLAYNGAVGAVLGVAAIGVSVILNRILARQAAARA
ncbi:MFS efflux transporter [Salinisphaera sp. PC39]|uniref:MFS transporter n=1 Tax=Salinisphaera sp. PC39 TaxID=1304156 RepID=UPI0033409A07